MFILGMKSLGLESKIREYLTEAAKKKILPGMLGNFDS